MKDSSHPGLPIPAAANAVFDGLVDAVYSVVSAALADLSGDENQADAHLVAARDRLQAMPAVCDAVWLAAIGVAS